MRTDTAASMQAGCGLVAHRHAHQPSTAHTGNGGTLAMPIGPSDTHWLPRHTSGRTSTRATSVAAAPAGAASPRACTTTSAPPACTSPGPAHALTRAPMAARSAGAAGSAPGSAANARPASSRQRPGSALASTGVLPHARREGYSKGSGDASSGQARSLHSRRHPARTFRLPFRAKCLVALRAPCEQHAVSRI